MKVTGVSCVAPCTFVVVASVALGVTPTTFGLNVAVAGVPFLSLRTIDTAVASPLNVGSGVNVTTPLSSIVYVPWFSTTSVVTSLSSPVLLGSISFALLVASNGTDTSWLLTVFLPGVNTGVTVCFAPWISLVTWLSPDGTAAFTTGV